MDLVALILKQISENIKFFTNLSNADLDKFLSNSKSEQIIFINTVRLLINNIH